jgi:8-oxo-dGTP diphosphatase
VVVGVVQNPAGEVLISFRDPSLHQGGLWEFPGGKVDPGEDVKGALCREFQEELGITPTEYFPFKKIRFQYSDREVLLDVWRVTQFTGSPTGREGQAVQWKAAKELSFNEFPAANKDIVRLLQLPKEIPITPQAESLSELLELLTSWAEQKFDVAYFRQPQLNADTFSQWYRAATELCSDRGLAVFSSMDSTRAAGQGDTGGIHASASRLMALTHRPCGDERYFSASCHSLAELNKAQELGADFVFLSPVKPVERYGGSVSLGWEGFRELAGSVSLPVYALGGLVRSDIAQALAYGAYGIAGISGYR